MYSLNALNSTILRRSLYNGSVLPVQSARRTRVTKPISKRVRSMLPSNNRMVVAEKLNGRLAMLGFLAGSGYESYTGLNYVEQVATTYPYVIVLTAIIGLATLKTSNLELLERRPFTTNLEILNGRMAMMGLLSKFIYDSGLLG